MTDQEIIEAAVARVRAKERHTLDPLTIEEIVRVTLAICAPAVRERYAEAINEIGQALDRMRPAGDAAIYTHNGQIAGLAKALKAIRALPLDGLTGGKGESEGAFCVRCGYPSKTHDYSLCDEYVPGAPAPAQEAGKAGLEVNLAAMSKLAEKRKAEVNALRAELAQARAARSEDAARHWYMHRDVTNAELKLAEKHCDWAAFKHAFNAVMKARREAMPSDPSAKGESQ